MLLLDLLSCHVFPQPQQLMVLLRDLKNFITDCLGNSWGILLPVLSRKLSQNLICSFGSVHLSHFCLDFIHLHSLSVQMTCLHHWFLFGWCLLDWGLEWGHFWGCPCRLGAASPPVPGGAAVFPSACTSSVVDGVCALHLLTCILCICGIWRLWCNVTQCSLLQLWFAALCLSVTEVFDNKIFVWNV